jgi:hypothetical protein
MLQWDEQRGCLVRNPRSTIDAATEWTWRRAHLVNPGSHWNGSFWEAHPRRAPAVLRAGQAGACAGALTRHAPLQEHPSRLQPLYVVVCHRRVPVQSANSPFKNSQID